MNLWQWNERMDGRPCSTTHDVNGIAMSPSGPKTSKWWPIIAFGITSWLAIVKLPDGEYKVRIEGSSRIRVR